MGQIPEPDKKPKYNSNKPYEWVDSQWEKFMERQREDAEYIQNLEGGVAEMEKKILKLTMEKSEMKDRLVELGESSWLKTLVHDTPNNMELGKKIRSMQDFWNEEQEGC